MKKAKRTEMIVTLTVVLTAITLLAAGVFAQTAGFRWFGPLTRMLTPNGDQRNDVVFLCFDNPSDSDVSGKVYSLLGVEVASFGPPQRVVPPGVPSCPAPSTGAPVQYLSWDGRSNGSVVPSGIYVYRVSAEQKVYSGTLVVVR